MFLYLSAPCNDLQVELLIHLYFTEISGYMLFHRVFPAKDYLLTTRFMSTTIHPNIAYNTHGA
jgi:hypothetical protein